MKETVLSAKTSGTARKRLEVTVEVIKKNPPPKFFFVFFTPCFFYFLGTCSVFAERVTYVNIMGTTLGMVLMVFDKFLIYLRFICKACRLTRISIRKFTGERVKRLEDSKDKIRKEEEEEETEQQQIY